MFAKIQEFLPKNEEIPDFELPYPQNVCTNPRIPKNIKIISRIYMRILEILFIFLGILGFPGFVQTFLCKHFLEKNVPAFNCEYCSSSTYILHK